MTKEKGFVMMEVLIALALFASTATALVVALNEVGNVTFELQRDRKIARILDSELRQVMSLPTLEEGQETRVLDELGIEIDVLIEPIEELENQDGQLLQNMFRIQLSAVWRDQVSGEFEKESVETWRYAPLYRE
ncbi:MAG: prepilin-type N-terminal cleavage/methylation domain-containing protein [Verrucomicrobiota bacterium]